MGSLWAQSPCQLQKEFVREVFQWMAVEGPEAADIAPRAAYAPLFVLDRRERFGQTGPDFRRLARRAGVETTQLQKELDGDALAMPALILPDELEFVRAARYCSRVRRGRALVSGLSLTHLQAAKRHQVGSPSA